MGMCLDSNRNTLSSLEMLCMDRPGTTQAAPAAGLPDRENSQIKTSVLRARLGTTACKQLSKGKRDL